MPEEAPVMRMVLLVRRDMAERWRWVVLKRRGRVWSIDRRRMW